MKTLKTMKTKLVLFALAVSLVPGLSSCISPGEFDGGQIIDYNRAILNATPQPRGTGRLGPLQPAPGTTGPMLRVDTDETGQSFIYLSLDEAVQRALANSIDIQVISYDPAIAREQAMQAAAAFDYVLFAGAQYQKSLPPSLFGLDTTTRTTAYQVGLQQNTVTGGTWQLTGTWTRTLDNSLIDQYRRFYQPTLSLQVQQPLLRNAGPEVNLAQLRIAQLNYRNTTAQFRQRVESVINGVVDGYWALIQARTNVEIQEELLRATEETRDRIRKRVEIDATLVELKQAEAAVESRRATLYRAQKSVFDVQDQLARLMADAQINTVCPYEIIPTTPPSKILVVIDPVDQLALALVYNPQLEQARLAISASQIAVRVAKNQTLPSLNLQAGVSSSAIDTSASQALKDVFSFEELGYSLGLMLEYPIGNRQALALWRQRQYEVGRSISTLQNLSDNLALTINERLRQINTSYKEMQATRLAVDASAAQLEALNSIERVRGRLTPEFLQLKLNAQESLANARFTEMGAIVSYNQALADLAMVTGTILQQYGIAMEKMPNVIENRGWTVMQGDTPARPIDLTLPGNTSQGEFDIPGNP